MPEPLTADIVFYEQQRIKSVWLWLLVISMNVLFVSALVAKLFFNISVGAKRVETTELIVVTILSLALTFLFCLLRLQTIIKADGIYVRLFPVHMKYRRLPWSSINKCFVRSYKPLAEYGGWGIRYGFTGKAYNISGNKGIQIVFNDNRKLLIGTQKSGAAEAAITACFPVP
jgi:lysylphosphatidylglycerol synthetase-like protein (DUF2156 family)